MQQDISSGEMRGTSQSPTSSRPARSDPSRSLRLCDRRALPRATPDRLSLHGVTPDFLLLTLFLQANHLHLIPFHYMRFYFLKKIFIFIFDYSWHATLY